jgi:Cytochrome P450
LFFSSFVSSPLFSHWLLANDERYFKNPSQFNPERFQSMRHSPMLNDGFAVFGAGRFFFSLFFILMIHTSVTLALET